MDNYWMLYSAIPKIINLPFVQTHGPVTADKVGVYMKSFTLFRRGVFKNDIGFLGQIRKMSSQFNFRALEFKLFCLSSCYCVSNSESGHSISF